MRKVILILIINPVIIFSQLSAQGLVGHWKFNGNANDDSGNAHNGIVNGPTLTDDRHGALNKSYLFNGTTDKIDLGTSSSFNITTQITVSLWVKLAAQPNGQDRVISKGSDKYVIYFQNNTVPVAYMMGSPNKALTFINGLELNEWYHLAFTYNSQATGNNFKAYIDGMLTAEQSTTGPLLTDNGNLVIGNFWNSTNYGFNGGIDEVRIYNRALTESEIQQIYSEEAAFTDANALCEQLFCTEDGVGVGSPTVPEGYKLSVKGKIITEGVKVLLSSKWPDYVFEDDYVLLPLSELKKFIDENKHLPGILPASEMEREGIDVEQVNIQLLKKIEELTLHIIEQEARMESFRQRLEELEKKQD